MSQFKSIHLTADEIRTLNSTLDWTYEDMNDLGCEDALLDIVAAELGRAQFTDTPVEMNNAMIERTTDICTRSEDETTDDHVSILRKLRDAQ